MVLGFVAVAGRRIRATTPSSSCNATADMTEYPVFVSGVNSGVPARKTARKPQTEGQEAQGPRERDVDEDEGIEALTDECAEGKLDDERDDEHSREDAIHFTGSPERSFGEGAGGGDGEAAHRGQDDLREDAVDGGQRDGIIGHAETAEGPWRQTAVKMDQAAILNALASDERWSCREPPSAR